MFLVQMIYYRVNEVRNKWNTWEKWRAYVCLKISDIDSITFHLQESKWLTAILSINITQIFHLVFYITGWPFGCKWRVIAWD